MDETVLTCPACGEETMHVAPTREKTDDGERVYRGAIEKCMNGECDLCDTVIAQRPITLCNHENRDFVPGQGVMYCKDCGVLDPDTQEGYDSKTPPWSKKF